MGLNFKDLSDCNFTFIVFFYLSKADGFMAAIYEHPFPVSVTLSHWLICYFAQADKVFCFGETE
jgi:hypothetical protein